MPKNYFYINGKKNISTLNFDQKHITNKIRRQKNDKYLYKIILIILKGKTHFYTYFQNIQDTCSY